jgi:hypothetical protein
MRSTSWNRRGSSVKVTSTLRSVGLSMSNTSRVGGELDQVEPEVPGIAVRLVRLYVANAAIIVLELALQEEVGLHLR